MNLIKNTIGHFKTVIIHKYWVFKYAKQIGIPWQGLIHDLSKFSWTEFSESVKFYQEGKSSPIVAAKKAQGYSLAWQHHKGRNPHHYEHWTDKYDDGTIALKMPFKYVLELIADYLGAGRAYQGKSFTPEAEYKWWKNHIDTKDIMMHEETKYFVSWVLHKFMTEGVHKINTNKIESLYNSGYFKFSDLGNSNI